MFTEKANATASNGSLNLDLDIVPKTKEEKEKKIDVVFEIMDALTAPVLTHCELWKDSIPKRLLDAIPMARLIAQMKQEQLATYEEVCAFIMTRTFEAPMDHDWTDIYTHVSCIVCERNWGEDHWDEVKAPRELSEYVKGHLTHLRKWIYKRRREHVKSKLKADKQTETDQPPLPPIIEDKNTQLNLF